MSKKTAPDRDPYLAAYRAAKAAHKAANAALKQAKIASRELTERRAAAAAAEFMALSALLRKPRAPLAVEACCPPAPATDTQTPDRVQAAEPAVRRKSARIAIRAES